MFHITFILYLHDSAVISGCGGDGHSATNEKTDKPVTLVQDCSKICEWKPTEFFSRDLRTFPAMIDWKNYFKQKQCFSYHNYVVSVPKTDQIISTALSRDKIEN